MVVGTVINLNDITGVVLMTSTGNFSFEIVAHQLNGDDLIYSGILYQVYGDGEKVGLSAGKCDLPTPMACQGRAFEAFEDIQPLLEDALSQFDGTAVIDLYSSIYITPSIVSSFPYGVDFTTSEDYGDSLVISAGSCDVVLSLRDNPSYLSFKDLVKISSFELTGEINFDFGYNDFYFVGFFNTPSGIVVDTVFGTSCITLKDCFPCEKRGVAAPISLDFFAPYDSLATSSMGSTFDKDNLFASVQVGDSFLDFSNILSGGSSLIPVPKRENIQQCDSVPQDFLICIDWFNAQDYQIEIAFGLVNLDILQLFELCDGTDDLCTALNQIIAEDIDVLEALSMEHLGPVEELSSEDQLMYLIVYLSNEVGCKSCRLQEINFNLCVERFTANYEGPFLNLIIRSLTRRTEQVGGSYTTRSKFNCECG